MVAFEPEDRHELNGTSATKKTSPEMAPASFTAAVHDGNLRNSVTDDRMMRGRALEVRELTKMLTEAPVRSMVS
jgi:hypothetical protein